VILCAALCRARTKATGIMPDQSPAPQAFV
jgi:hypothetical protein